MDNIADIEATISAENDADVSSPDELQTQQANDRMIVAAGIVVVFYYALRAITSSLEIGEVTQLLELLYFAIAASIFLRLYSRVHGTSWPDAYRHVSITLWIGLPVCFLTVQGQLIDAGLHLLLLVPLVEELFFRGFLFKLLQKSLGWFMGAILTSIIFALMHSHTDIRFMASMMLLSFVCCMLMRYRLGLILAVVTHAMWNIFAGANGLDMVDAGSGFALTMMSLYVVLSVSALVIWFTRKRDARQA